MNEQEIKDLVNKHEILVSKKYKNKGIKTKFTTFGHIATINAIKEILKPKEDEFRKTLSS